MLQDAVIRPPPPLRHAQHVLGPLDRAYVFSLFLFFRVFVA